jgi:hypothetical protein
MALEAWLDSSWKATAEFDPINVGISARYVARAESETRRHVKALNSNLTSRDGPVYRQG